MCLETKRIIKSRDVVFLEGTKEVEGVRDKRSLSNQIEHLVVDEVDELNPISLKARPTKDVEGDESTTNSSSEEEFASSEDEGLNHNKMDQEKGPKDNVRSGLVIGGSPPKRWNEPPWHFRKNPKPWKRR
jgi:hypothetical protein